MRLLRLLKKRTKRKEDIRKIYKTTDGYFTGTDKNKKPRRVAVVEQRKDDGALAVVKIFSAKGKNANIYIDGILLPANKHSSLTEDSLVGSQVYVGVKMKEGFKSIYKGDFVPTDDKLTRREHCSIMKKAGGKTKKNRKTNKRKIKNWKKHFKK